MAGVRVEQSFGDLREWQKLGLSRHWGGLIAMSAMRTAADIGYVGRPSGFRLGEHRRKLHWQ
jgi:hypothetical protein